MAAMIDILIIDRDEQSSMALYDSLHDFLDLGEVDYTNSIPKGLSLCLESHYTMCLVCGNIFDRAHLRSFIKDVRKISQSWEFPCGFVLVQDPEQKRFDEEAAKQMGFDCIMTRPKDDGHVGSEDRKSLLSLLKAVLYEREVQTRIYEINSSLETILKELDLVASEMKRGAKNKKLNKNLMRYIQDQALFDHKVLESYYRALMEKTGVSAPNEIISLDIPKEILEKNLPGMTATGYVGQSCRVWDRLVKRFGVFESDSD